METKVYYGPFTKQDAKYWYSFYSASSVTGEIDWAIAKRFMSFYSLYL
jgi:hypothetical protein